MTPPVPLSTMSGNFDYPPASGSTNAPSVSPHLPSTASVSFQDPTARLQHLRDLLRRDRERERAGRPTMEAETAHQIAERRRRRAMIHEIGRLRAAGEAPGSGSLVATSDSPTSAVRTRPHATPSARYLQRRRQEQDSYHSSALAGLQQAGERLAEASSNLSSLLDQPIPRIASPDLATQEYSGEAEVNRRRSKRRKLETDGTGGGIQGFSYGHFGQVVPGQLKMEIVSCDGGNHIEQSGGAKDYWAENVLRNDQSVYCTKSNRCNMILRHQGETTFCLKKLVIKAPERGFTAPVQEGMVFVSMTSNDLLARTAQYQIHYTSSPSRTASGPSATHGRDDPRPFTGRLSLHSRDHHPPSAANYPPPPIPRREYHASWSSPQDTANILTNPIHLNGPAETNIDADLDSFLNSDHNSPTANLPSPLPFTVVTDCDDKSGDEEEESSAAILADRYRRDRIAATYSSDDDDEDGGLSRLVNRHHRIMGPPTGGIRRSRRRATPSRIEPSMTQSADSHLNNENLPLPSEVMVPHARFFIERERSMVSMKFDPPVSGRYILLKFWSPARDENIDIQSIIVHGFAGPRFFPAVQLM
ncbi:MAG: hypothetical protein M1830_003336 [Pleopsidium flavum]|nr:MAG: hypothetical protein M1830_003336 [Pleopsidium flavum]